MEMNSIKPLASRWINQNLILFHGTTLKVAQAIIGSGVDLATSRSLLDFGVGFYTTTSEDQARGWARRKTTIPDTPALVRYEVDRNDFAKLEFLAFIRSDHMAHDFWDFVLHCRRGGLGHSKVSSAGFYDVVAGPLVKQWKSGRAIHPASDQFSFHTHQGIQLLQNSSPQLIL